MKQMIRLSRNVDIVTDVAIAEGMTPEPLGGGRPGEVRVGMVVSPQFEAFARVLHPAADSEGHPVRWGEVADWARRVVHPEMQWEAISRPAYPEASAAPWESDPEVGHCPRTIRAALAGILGEHTAAQERCHGLLWAGYGGVSESIPGSVRVHVPGRDYLLVSAPLGTIVEGIFEGPGSGGLTPNVWWPDDRAWCVATEVDFCWTYVAGTRACVEDVLSDERLEVVESHPDHRADYRSDILNGPVEPPS